MKKEARNSTTKKKPNPKRAGRLNASQMALAVVEKIIAGKLANQKKRD
jgi:hypothetical protein